MGGTHTITLNRAELTIVYHALLSKYVGLSNDMRTTNDRRTLELGMIIENLAHQLEVIDSENLASKYGEAGARGISFLSEIPALGEHQEDWI